MRSEDRASFARAVWSEFGRLSGEVREPSAREWYVLSKWMDSSIPLAVILRAFGEFNGTPRVLGAMEGPVQRAYSYYANAMGLTR